MEWIALEAVRSTAAFRKRQIESRVVAHEDGPPAAMGADGGADLAEHALQRIGLVDGRPQRMPGVDAVDLQRRRIPMRLPSKGFT